MTVSLRPVLCLGKRNLFALLSGHIVARLPGNLSLYLVLDSLALLLGIILSDLPVFCLAILFVFSTTVFFGNLGTLLPEN